MNDLPERHELLAVGERAHDEGAAAAAQARDREHPGGARVVDVVFQRRSRLAGRGGRHLKNHRRSSMLQATVEFSMPLTPAV